jgi:hypothetical protein
MLEPLPATVTPTQQDGKWRLCFGSTCLEVEARTGARISSYRLDGDEVLTGPEVNPDNWGSTFWPSPQSAWGWPPPSEIDTAEYRVAIDGNVLVLSGATVASGGVAGLAITKRIGANAERAMVSVEYEIGNRGSQPCEVAGWEITRVPRNNLHFFPEGDPGEVKKFQDLLPLQSRGGVAWLDHDPARMDRDLLVGRHGAEGWMASLRGDLLFVKSFPEVPPSRCAPGEADVLLFSSGASAYVEVEAQSAMACLAPGATLRWPVRWAARRLPPGLDRTLGSAALVDFVRRVVR